MSAKILIVEDDFDTLQALCLRLRAAGYQVVGAGDGAAALRTAQKEYPNLILLDWSLPGGDGSTVLRSLKGLLPLSGIPVVVFSARDPVACRDAALQAGAVAFLPKPLDNAELMATLARFARSSPAPRQVLPQLRRILVVEDDTDTRRGICLRLRSAGYDVVEAADSIAAVSVAIGEHPDLILLDLGLPGGNGFALLERLKMHPSLGVIPVVVLTAWDRRSYEETVRKNPVVACCLQKPVEPQTLLDAVRNVLCEDTGETRGAPVSLSRESVARA